MMRLTKMAMLILEASAVVVLRKNAPISPPSQIHQGAFDNSLIAGSGIRKAVQYNSSATVPTINEIVEARVGLPTHFASCELTPVCKGIAAPAMRANKRN